MAFEGIDIRIGGSSADAKAAIASVRSSLGGLERSANSAEDSMEELGDSATRTTGSLGGLAATAGATALSLTGVSTAGTGASTSMTALAVSVGTATAVVIGLSAVLAPLVATLGAVAAAASGLALAFGAVVGSGLLAFGEKRAEQNREELQQIKRRIARLQALKNTQEGLNAAQRRELEQLQEKADSVEETTTVTGALAGVLGDLREQIQPVISRLGREFIPLIRDTIAAIPELVRSTVDALGPLDQFEDALRAFGASAMEAIPQIVSMLADLARRALPVLGDLLEAIGERGPRAFDAMIRATERVGDDLLKIAGAFADVLPPLTRFGITVIEVATPAITAFLTALEGVLRAFNSLPAPIRKASVAAIALVPVITVLSATISAVTTAAVAFGGAFTTLVSVGGTLLGVLGTIVSILGGPLTAAILAGIGLLVAYKKNWLGVRDAVSAVIEEIKGLIEWVQQIPSRVMSLTTGGGDGERDGARRPRSRAAARAGGSGVVGLDSGGLIDQSGLAMVHAGERVVPEAQVSDRGGVESASAGQIRDALAGMSLSLGGELDVSGDVATMRDVDARLRRAGREAENRGIRR